MGCLGSWRAFQSAKVIWYTLMRRFTLIGSRNARTERSPAVGRPTTTYLPTLASHASNLLDSPANSLDQLMPRE